MKLWLLRPNDSLESNDNPWEPWYDKCFGFVIRAETEGEARHIASQNGGDENDTVYFGNQETVDLKAWLNQKYSTCLEITPDGKKGIIMSDNRSA
jgi:hypothetical protein